MTYEVVLAASAQRQLLALPEAVATAVYEFLAGDLATNPYRVGKPLLAPREGQYSARRGEYRIIYTIDDYRVLVRVVAFSHRRDAYRT